MFSQCCPQMQHPDAHRRAVPGMGEQQLRRVRAAGFLRLRLAARPLVLVQVPDVQQLPCAPLML